MPRKRPAPSVEGALLINKPAGKTSHDVVDAVRRILGFREIGHLGTLDPLATGVLALLLGRATRLARFYVGRRKRYDCAIRFGFATDTYDADGEPAGPDAAPEIIREQAEALAAQFVGRFPQVPPPYSAKKIHGRPAHELARKKKPVELKAVEVEVYEFRITAVKSSLVRCVIECAAGTYIRSLAHEMGIRQGSGAHLAEIARTAVGEFTLDQTITLQELEQAARANRLAEVVLPIERLLSDLPRVTVLPVIERRVRHGARFNVQIAQIQPGRVTSAQGATAQLDSGELKPPCLRVFNHEEKLIAIAQAIVPRTYQPVVVLDAAP
ncbi:MAG: tRNA pseudouridine(55) synthase TruB [Acidobacteria bacterium]|nr:tRNA pseudouridine(55) synthase TruB [Acidobacteriota bacterium]MBI3664487.1 tRNA pseudouridine(55) synthase TruB [Acidobacteriota bacterium]